MNSVMNLRDALRHSSQAGRLTEVLEALPELRAWLDRDFASLCHAHQEPPAAANNGKPWTTWLVLGGRGAGKTRLGAEWVRAAAYGTTPYAERRHRHIALIGETEHDVREVMIEGVSGLLRIAPRDERPLWFPTRRRLEWPNGAVAQAFSAEDPESLRGPQFDAAWCDELAKWRRADDAFDMLQFGLRLGQRPRQLITTTPRPTALIKRLIADPRTAVTRAATHANAAHSLARVPRRDRAALRRHAARPAGDPRRDHRGPPRRAVVARHDRGGPRARSAAARAHRGRDRSAGGQPAGLGRLRHRGGGARRGRHDLRAGGRDRRGARARRLGRARDRGLSPARGRHAGRGGQPGRRDGARRDPRRSMRACRSRPCTRRAASGCAPSRSPRCMRRGG